MHSHAPCRALTCLLALVLVGLFPCGSLADDSPMWTEKTIFDHLTEIVADHFQSERAAMSRESKLRLESVISAAASRIVSDGATQDRVLEAEQNVRTLASSLVKRSDHIKSANGSVQHEITNSTLESVLDWICPLYPFC